MPTLPGTRADLFVTLVYVIQLLAPLVVMRSFRAARARMFRRHRQIQLVLLGCCTVAVLALETRIRLAGGSGVLTAGGTFSGTLAFRIVFSIHVAAAVLTYLLWAWLALTSTRRFGHELPGSFSARHRTIGKTVFGGLCFTALSATAMFILGFVA